MQNLGSAEQKGFISKPTGFIDWKTEEFVEVGEYRIPCSPGLLDQPNQAACVRNDASHYRAKRALWFLAKAYQDLSCDGFIEWDIGRLMNGYIEPDTVLLDIGCGDMSLIKYVPTDIWYNGLDVSLSEFHIKRTLRANKNANIVLASATSMPIESNSVTLIVSTECFEHIPDFERALVEIHRIAAPNSTVLCSIPNNFCYKYQVKGPHAGHVNNWTYDGFISLMERRGFKSVSGYMKGVWIPMPLGLWKLVNTSYQLPIRAKQEFHSTNFFYVFSVNKS